MPEPHWIDLQAPNAGTLDRAYALAQARRWSALGLADGLCWGVFPTRGAHQYQVLADPAAGRHYCNCSAPHFPCKHVLALLVLWRDKQQLLQNEKPPQWLPAWVKRARQDRSEADTAAERLAQQARNHDQRLETMAEGATDLLRWMTDLLRLGLGQAASLPASFWENPASRMVDAKLGGIARRIRAWPDLLTQPDGHDALLEELGSTYLLAKALQRLDQLPGPLRQSALGQAGLAQRKKEVKALPAIDDRWLVMGIEHGEDETLFFRRVWLLSESDARPALLLDFAHGNPEFEGEWRVGLAVQGLLHYYPGARELRALFSTYGPSDRPFRLGGGHDQVESMLEAYAGALAENPWLKTYPFLLNEMVPAGKPGAWQLVDQQERALNLSVSDRAGWQLLALSGGDRIRVFGGWDGERFQALSVATGARVLALDQAVSSRSRS